MKPYTEMDVRRYAQQIAGHPDALVARYHLDAARAILDGLTQEGRLLPADREVEHAWAVRWYLPGDAGMDEQDCRGNAIETAEERARRLAAMRPVGAVRGEAVRYDTFTVVGAVFPGGGDAEAA